MKLRVFFTQAAVILVLIGAWEYGAAVGAIDPKILPSPSQVIFAMKGLLQSGAFMADASDTIVRVIAPFLLARRSRSALGFVMGENLEHRAIPLADLQSRSVGAAIDFPAGFRAGFWPGLHRKADFRHHPRCLRRCSKRDGGRARSAARSGRACALFRCEQVPDLPIDLPAGNGAAGRDRASARR